MTSTRRLQLTAAFAAASVLLAVSSTVSALASPGSDAAPAAARVAVAASPSAPDPEPTTHAAPAVVVTPTPTPTPTHASPSPTPPAATPSPSRTVTRVVTKVTTSVAKPASRPTAKKTSAPVAAAKAVAGITISRYVDAPGSQAAIDQCKLVLWAHTPLWLAGHNYCGYQWMAYVPTGATVRVATGAATGTFVVTGHVRLSRQGGAMPALNADLVLQTCVGSGTALTLLRRV